MAIDFPNSPSNGQVFSAGGSRWAYNAAGGYWKAEFATAPVHEAIVSLEANTAVPGASGWVVVNMDTFTSDPLSMWDDSNNRATAPAGKAGWYFFTIETSVVSTSGAFGMSVKWEVTGGHTDSGQIDQIAASSTHTTGGVIYLETGTYLSLYMACGMGSPQTGTFDYVRLRLVPVLLRR